MTELAISGTGVYTSGNAVTNEQLVESYNKWVTKYNDEHASEIADGSLEAKQESSCEFIEKASGIKQRYLMETKGPLDINRMRPGLADIAEPDITGQPVMVKMMLEAAKGALAEAGIDGSEIDLVISSSTPAERYAPILAAEVMEEIGAQGFSFDMQCGCSSATFGISTACDTIISGMANKALVVTCEYLSPFINYTDRDSHFIFGDACVAMVIEKAEDVNAKDAFKILSRKHLTKYSENITAHFGNRIMVQPELLDHPAIRFLQNGRTVFKELVPMAINHVQTHLTENDIAVSDLKRMWLHQANINMNKFAARKLLGHEASNEESPIILDEYANTGGAGCLIAFNNHKKDLEPGDKGVICSFGAGYSVGSLLVEKI